MNRWRSRIVRSAATTRWLIRRKSPVSTGIETFVRRANDAIKRGRRPKLEARLAAASAARCVHDVVAGAKMREELLDEFGRVLKVAVHEYHGIARARGRVRPSLRFDGRNCAASDTMRMRPSRDAASCNRCKVASREPSSTQMISQANGGSGSPASTAAMRRSNSSTLAASL